MQTLNNDLLGLFIPQTDLIVQYIGAYIVVKNYGQI